MAMRVIKHILVAVALLATMLPCGHALAHHDHQHDVNVDLCGITCEPCSCHSCEHQPCADDAEIQVDRSPDTAGIEHPAAPTLLLELPEIKPVFRQHRSPVSGILAALLTVQLLI